MFIIGLRHVREKERKREGTVKKLRTSADAGHVRRPAHARALYLCEQAARSRTTVDPWSSPPHPLPFPTAAPLSPFILAFPFALRLQHAQDHTGLPLPYPLPLPLPCSSLRLLFLSPSCILSLSAVPFSPASSRPFRPLSPPPLPVLFLTLSRILSRSPDVHVATAARREVPLPRCQVPLERRR